MQIKISDSPHTLGKGLPVEITFPNATGSVLTRENPETSRAVEMHVLDLKTKEDLSYPMGKVTTTIMGPDDQYAIVVPPPQNIQIPAGGAVVFTSDLNERLYLRPGAFDAFLTEGPAASNHVDLEIHFTRESVDTLLAIAQDEKAEYGRREWAMDFLSQLQRDFKLKLPQPGDSDAQKAKAEAENKVVIAAFETWWSKNRDAPATDALLKKVR